ncbi:possible scaffolding protein [Streptococcus phage Cp1]|uniref:Possible scaffolding protein n=1 Tax=Streptococcus phage Cp-1 TaxID=10747 RepID=Q37992_BPCP1|nr:possible scaffolding protein [Streptococcus phage Cp1]CAA87728.1 possible scaffolding protein [Streptococcus phage Cp1]
MTSQECLAVLDAAMAKVGNDEEIESLTADLIDIKAFVGEIDTVVSVLNEDVERPNLKNGNLRSANNELYRRLGQQDEIMKQAQEDMSVVSAINAVI